MHFSAGRHGAFSVMAGTMFVFLCIAQVAMAACPYMQDGYGLEEQPSGKEPHNHLKRQVSAPSSSPLPGPVDTFLDQFTLNDTDVYMTSDVGGPIQDQESLKAGLRGPTLLEDFMFRQKIQHFDHERVSHTHDAGTT
jgi:catalase